MVLRCVVIALVLPLAALAQQQTSFDAQFKDAAAGFGGRLGVAAENVLDGEKVFYNADSLFPTASVIKLPVLVELFYKFHDGELSPEKSVMLIDSLKKPGSGVLQFIQPNQTLKL